MSTQILSVEKLTKVFGQKENALMVLDSVSIDFKQGERYAITGVSGSGKSTFMHLLAGLDEPTAGDVVVDDASIFAMDSEKKARYLNKEFGLVFQRPYLIRELSVIENVMLKGIIAGGDIFVYEKRAHELLKEIGLLDKANHAPLSLSGGQQQQVAILRAIFNKPAFLLMDEPTGNLDSATGARIVDLILSLQQESGMGVIVSTHDAYVASAMGTIYSLRQGRLSAV